MAFWSGVKHHIGIARAALQREREHEESLKGKARAKRDELAFLPAALEITSTPAAPLGRAIALALCAFFFIAVAWATFGEMDIVATSEGKIITRDRVKIIQPLETGVVRRILVKDGQRVARGDILVELDPTGSEADRHKLHEELTIAQVENARLSALLTDDPEKNFTPPKTASRSLIDLQAAFLKSQVRQYATERATLAADIVRGEAEIQTVVANTERLLARLEKTAERVEGFRVLYEKGVLPKLKFTEDEEALLSLEGDIDVERNRLLESEANLETAKARMAQGQAVFEQNIHAELAQVRQRLNAVGQELVKAAKLHGLRNLTAPVDGYVQQLDVHTIGGVVTPAQPLMQIVPENSAIEVEAMVLNKDVGFIRKGQKAELKIQSFPFTKYGTIDGSVRHIYADAIENEILGLTYPTRIAMARTSVLAGDEHVELTPGMAVTVEIKTGKRNIIDYILTPLLEYQDESLRER
jgi:HlyD family type I secretion membrane fusion protein